MSLAAAAKANTEPLDAFDPGLPFLASEAAIELDNLLLGKTNIGLPSVERLARRLEQSTEQLNEGPERRSIMDPATVAVFSSAVTASGQVPHTLAELASQAARLAQELHRSRKTPGSAQLDRALLESLRTFCVYLAQSAAAHERSLHEVSRIDANWS